MRKSVVLLAVALAALLVSVPIAYAGTITAVAEQHPVSGSGIHGLVHFTDDGSTLTVEGTATGLTAHTPYFSLIYTVGVGPGGVSETKSLPPTSDAIAACNDVNRLGTSAITATQMVVGFWTNNNDGTGVLHDVKTKTGNSQDLIFQSIPPLKAFLLSVGYVFGGVSYVPINGTWRTVSIRDGSKEFALVACGLVH